MYVYIYIYIYIYIYTYIYIYVNSSAKIALFWISIKSFNFIESSHVAAY